MTRTFLIDFDPASADSGWMDAWLVIDGQRHHMYTTSVFPPFKDLLQFAHALAANQLPHEFSWEEEGPEANFQALPSASDSDQFRLLINHNGDIILNAEFNRHQMMNMVLESLRKVCLDCPGAESEWEFPYFLLEDFEEKLKKGLLSRPAEEPDHRARFVFYHFGGYGGVENPVFRIWIGSQDFVSVDLKDNALHWQDWFTLLEKLRAGELPVELEIRHDQDIEEENPILLPWQSLSTTYQLESMPDKHLFQLTITENFPKALPENHPTTVKVILDRRQFVESFVQSFQEFLQTNYLAFLNSGECEFDLRTLPLDKLYR